MKGIILILTGCLILGTMVVFALYTVSDTIVHKRSSFIRLYPPHPISEEIELLDLKYNSYYIAGATSRNIFLANSVAPFHMVVSNKILRDTQHVRLSIIDRDRKFRSLQVRVDSPYFYLCDGVLPSVYRGKLGDWLNAYEIANRAKFSNIAPLGPASFAIRSLNSIANQDVLGKMTNENVMLNHSLLEKQIDGVFCVDGMLNYNEATATLVYVYFYRNQFIVMDTSMNLMYRSNTIDTISRAQIKVDTINSKKLYTYTMSAPPLMVNKKSCLYQNWLFINSDRLAKNENQLAFDQSSVIDVYNLVDGKYQFSFYIYKHNDAKMKEFRVFDGKLYALFDHFIISYELSKNLFRHPQGSH